MNMENRPIIKKEQVETVYDSRFIKVFDLQYEPGKQDTPIFTAAETEQFSDEYIETILDHSMMDDYTLYQYLTDANSDMYN